MSDPNLIHEKEMGLFEHLAELRRCLVAIALSVCAGAALTYGYSREIVAILSKPYHDSFSNNLLIGTGPAEAFILHMKLAIFAGSLLASPMIFYQLWRFIAPGLYPPERKMVLPFVLVSTCLFIGGVVFCYHAVFPLAFGFFHDEYAVMGITPTIRMSEHLSMIAQSMLAFGAVFELPVLAFFLGRAGIIDAPMLISGFRYAVIVIFIAAAIFTPPDVFSQMAMAVPLMVLYGLSILIVKYFGKKKAVNEAAPPPVN